LVLTSIARLRLFAKPTIRNIERQLVVGAAESAARKRQGISLR
jgi:hypothetical protein